MGQNLNLPTACRLGLAFAVSAAFVGCSHHVSSAAAAPSPPVSSPAQLSAGYSASAYLSSEAPAFARGHRHEITEALRRATPADRSRLRYTMALTGRGDQRVFIIFRDIGQPADTTLRQLYVVLNLRNVNYDPFTNTIVAQPAF